MQRHLPANELRANLVKPIEMGWGGIAGEP